MSTSKSHHVLGFRLDGGLVPSSSPGPLGLNDRADPNVTALRGDSPGPLGHQDYADPAIPAPLRLRLDEGPLVSMPKGLVESHQLKRLFTAASDEWLDTVIGELERNPAAFELDSRLRIAHFFAQVREETCARAKKGLCKAC